MICFPVAFYNADKVLLGWVCYSKEIPIKPSKSVKSASSICFLTSRVLFPPIPKTNGNVLLLIFITCFITSCFSAAERVAASAGS